MSIKVGTRYYGLFDSDWLPCVVIGQWDDWYAVVMMPRCVELRKCRKFKTWPTGQEIED